jgi:pimeloyl-ACP methyl ester carboxylesterase
MDMKTSSNHQAITPAQQHYTTGSVTSFDGTLIGYRQYGSGPGLVLVQGAMGSAHNFSQLAKALSDTFTVYVPDRRGRGLSPLLYRQDHSVQRDVEDLEALLTKTGTHHVFGLSSGALILLQAALTLPTIQKAAIYEPPLFVNGLPTALLARYEREITQDKLAGALITSMKAAQMGPPLVQAMPHWLLSPLMSKIMTSEDKHGSGEYLSMRTLAPTLRYDFQVVTEMNGTLDSFRAIPCEVLLLGASKSPSYLKADLDALEKILPHVKRVELLGLDHGSSWNYDKQRNPGGQPEVVAQELRQFFAEL